MNFPQSRFWNARWHCRRLNTISCGKLKLIRNILRHKCFVQLQSRSRNQINCCFHWWKRGLYKFTVEMCLQVFKRYSSLTREYPCRDYGLAFLSPVREAALLSNSRFHFYPNYGLSRNQICQKFQDCLHH